MARRGLGRGFNALLGASSPGEAPSPEAEAGEGLRQIEVEKLDPSPWQPRQTFDEEKLESLAQSIREQGLVQPLVVRRKGDRFEVVTGERRLRAVRTLGWRRVPAVLMEASDDRIRELALVENLQRDDLDPIETALAYQALRDEHQLTQERIAERLGVSRARVTNTLRLLRLPDEVRSMIVRGDLTEGHARALLALPEAASQIRLARRIVEEGLTVRQAEKAVQPRTAAPASAAPPARPKDPAVRDVEARLRDHLQTKVTVKDRKGRGRIVIEYYSHDDVARILERLGLSETL